MVEIEKVLNEEIASKFSTAYMIEMYINDIEGFQGDGDLLSKFGMQLKDQCTFIVSKKRWNQLVQIINNDIDQERPFEGDLIYLPLAKTLFEIRFVEHESPFYQLNKVPVYELKCEQFTYENQKIDTGIPEIDSIETDNANVTNVLVTTLSGTFKLGEKVTITTPTNVEIQAEYVKKHTAQSGTIFSLTTLTYPEGKFIPLVGGYTIEGVTSNAQGVIGTVIGLSDPYFENYTNDPVQDNDVYKKKIIDFVDFSENNPFGEM